MAETQARGSKNPFAENAGVRVHQAKGGVVADRADVADVIGEALKLGHQSPQVNGAARNLDFERGFNGVGESEGVGDGAVAGNPARETRGAIDRRVDHQLLYALVGVTEPFLKADDDFPIR